MKLYSYQGQKPEQLPERIRLEDGTTLTNLDNLPQEELSFYGFSEPIEEPVIDIAKQKLFWNGSEYIVEDIPQEVLDQREQDQKRKQIESIDRDNFLNIFKSTSFGKRIRKESGINLKLNILYTELISNIKSVQTLTQIFEDFNKLYLSIDFTEEEIESLHAFLEEFKLTYQVPNENIEYEFDTDSIIDISKRPFESWIWNGIKWTAPVPYPNDKKPYVWNESTKKWKKI